MYKGKFVTSHSLKNDLFRLPRELSERRAYMKRVKAACILQTLVFSQRPELGFSAEAARKVNLEEVENYKRSLERAKTRYVITDTVEEADGSVVVRVKKQYNDKADVSEYFN